MEVNMQKCPKKSSLTPYNLFKSIIAKSIVYVKTLKGQF